MEEVKTVKHFINDNEFLIICKSKWNGDNWNWIDFLVYEIPAVSVQESPIPQFNIKGYTGSGEYTEDYEKAEVYISGFLKWDGCCEMDFNDASHFCGFKSAMILARIVESLYQIAVLDFQFDVGEKMEEVFPPHWTEEEKKQIQATSKEAMKTNSV